MTYKELVRKIHPDLNPDITNAGEKMAEIQRYKNNPVMLKNIAIRWGLVEGKNPKVCEGVLVSFRTNGKTLTGPIIDIIQKDGGFIFVIYVRESFFESPIVSAANHENGKYPFKVTDNIVSRPSVGFLKTMYREKKNTPKYRWEYFNAVLLNRNAWYRNSNTQIWDRKTGSWYEIIKTTNEFAVFFDGEKWRRIKINPKRKTVNARRSVRV